MAESVALHPVLSKLWDADKNGAAGAILARSYRAAWWRCENGHSFQRAPRAMLSDPACPECRRGPSSKSLAKARPSLVPLWNVEKNGALTPTTVDATHTGITWWRCLKGHDFQRAPLLMVKDSSCPVCAVAQKSLAKVSPAVAAEWHPERNGAITPSEVHADHMMNAW